MKRDLASPDSTLVDLDALGTEARDPANADLDLRSTAELVGLMNHQDATVPGAVAAAGSQIVGAVDAIAARFAAGGRLVYVGAGTSGRLAALDAAECETTFSTPVGRVLALVAGGESASPADQAAAEDDEEAGRVVNRRQRYLRRGCGDRRERERTNAVRASAHSARLRRPARSPSASCRSWIPSLARLAEHPIAVARRARADRRLHAAQGRHGAEARAQHDLDGVP